MKSPKEINVEKLLLDYVKDNPLVSQLLHILIADPEIEALQDYANSVSIVRLGYNDHGPVHMKIVTLNALKILDLLKKAGVQTSLQKEGSGSLDDSYCAVVLGAYLHDIGMSLTRQDHELFSMTLALPIIERTMDKMGITSFTRRAVIKAMASECIIGHMASRRIHSIEAGIVLIADGCDMKKGRARIPMEMNTEAKIGDIHKYSANSIKSVSIAAGKEKPVRIDVLMDSDVGFFQVEEVLMGKINMSPAKPFISLYAQSGDKEAKQYL
ncbi:phosphohydrolase [Treponema sp. OMZ 792]|uniref:phosphohydrolase n=1 Tax=unclassified Treponema TaxID=2638727 RepID=UPI0020A53376|nr:MULTISPECIES: phosphohydrolase [unclassified Treponema]UTC74595.1 phosphohydrolase [Treponema sp. OMZ 792]UTC77128.1 phosphohydrolase [Treponema sp. OMZ 799]UTC80992.1 phosphohydrolase [Treponema sp. OMZ 798]